MCLDRRRWLTKKSRFANLEELQRLHTNGLTQPCWSELCPISFTLDLGCEPGFLCPLPVRYIGIWLVTLDTHKGVWVAAANTLRYVQSFLPHETTKRAFRLGTFLRDDGMVFFTLVLIKKVFPVPWSNFENLMAVMGKDLIFFIYLLLFRKHFKNIFLLNGRDCMGVKPFQRREW